MEVLILAPEGVLRISIGHAEDTKEALTRHVHQKCYDDQDAHAGHKFQISFHTSSRLDPWLVIRTCCSLRYNRAHEHRRYSRYGYQIHRYAR